MARPLRIEFPGATYHVMSHGVAGTPTFIDDPVRNHFLDSLREMVEIGKLLIHAFILMTNHFHLLCETPLSGLSRHMQQLLGKHTQWFNRRRNRHGHLWQARYKAVLVENGEYFLQCSRYIHLNPVKANICAGPEEYSWSSYCQYLNCSPTHNWISTSRTLDCFPNKSDYVSFVLQGLQNELKNPFEEAVGGTIFGSKDFVNRVSALVHTTNAAEVIGVRELKQKHVPSIGAVDTAVNEIFPGLSQCQRNRILIYAMRRFTERTGSEIAAIMGRSPSAVTHIWREIQMRLLNDHEFQQKMDALTQLLEVLQQEE